MEETPIDSFLKCKSVTFIEFLQLYSPLNLIYHTINITNQHLKHFDFCLTVLFLFLTVNLYYVLHIDYIKPFQNTKKIDGFYTFNN